MAKTIKVLISLLGGVCFVLIDSANVAVSNPLTIWTAPSLERIGMTGQPGTSTSIELYAARGEFEAFQIGVQASQNDITDVKIAVSDLVATNGNTLSNANIELYREHYVYVDAPSPADNGGSNSPLGEGWYADGLIPIADAVTGQNFPGVQVDTRLFDIEAGENHPFWVDIFVPRDAQAGQYSGTFTVTSDQGTSTGEITLNVWDFELPTESSLSTAFGFYGDQTKQASEELLRHRVTPQFLSNPKPDLERQLIDEFGLQSVNLGFWSGGEAFNCQMTAPPSVGEIQTAVSLHESDLFKYVYSADEIGGCTNLYEAVKDWGRTLHIAGVDHLVVMPPVPELFDDGSGTGRSAVDIWVVLPSDYEAAAGNISTALAKGDQVWSYNALVQDGYSPKWQIDFDPINLRIQPGFITQSLGLTGLLYWRVDGWTDDPWNDVTTFTDRNGRSYSGDGMLVYPGEPIGLDGIVPSMRLKWLREGIEDYEYIEILKQLGQSEQALQLSRLVGANWQDWTKDPKLLASVRLQLGNEIERLMKERSAVDDNSQITDPQIQPAEPSAVLPDPRVASPLFRDVQLQPQRQQPQAISLSQSVSLERLPPSNSNTFELTINYDGLDQERDDILGVANYQPLDVIDRLSFEEMPVSLDGRLWLLYSLFNI